MAWKALSSTFSQKSRTKTPHPTPCAHIHSKIHSELDAMLSRGRLMHAPWKYCVYSNYKIRYSLNSQYYCSCYVVLLFRYPERSIPWQTKIVIARPKGKAYCIQKAEYRSRHHLTDSYIRATWSSRLISPLPRKPGSGHFLWGIISLEKI